MTKGEISHAGQINDLTECVRWQYFTFNNLFGTQNSVLTPHAAVTMSTIGGEVRCT